MSKSNPKRHSTGSYQNHEFEQDIGRATRARTRLIVEGFSNLALIATFFAGVQAQLISVTNGDNTGPVAMATNAAFFGGLIFSIFTAVLATLSARWFSILREDDADFLSSRWLAQDSGVTEDEFLRKYLDYQIGSLERIERGEGGNQGGSSSNLLTQRFNPTHFDARCILELLKQERGTENKISEKARRRLTQSSGGEDESKSPQVDENVADIAKTTIRERILSYVLISPLIACLPSFGLFTAGMLLLVWDKQPRPVAIFTSVTVLVCVLPLCGFFVSHRHKHVISNIYLGRPSY